MKKNKLLLPLFLISLLLLYLFRFKLEIGLGHFWYGQVNKKQVVENQGERHGETEEYKFHSNMLNADRTALIYLPAGYHDYLVRYPVIYLLHGFAGSYNDWIINANLVSELDTLIDSHKLPPVVVVFLDGNGPLNTDSQYLDAVKIKQPMESHIIKELIPEIDSHYHTIPESSYRAVAGLSAGGYGAVNLTFHNPNVFGYAISLSGYFMADDPTTKKLLGNDKKSLAYNSPLLFIDTFESTPSAGLYLTAGEGDGKYLVATKSFAQALTKKNISYQLNIGKGLHLWSNWRNMIVDGLTWLGTKWGE